jgi:hypothetical protein
MFRSIRAMRSRVRRPIGSNHYDSRFTVKTWHIPTQSWSSKIQGQNYVKYNGIYQNVGLISVKFRVLRNWISRLLGQSRLGPSSISCCPTLAVRDNIFLLN